MLRPNNVIFTSVWGAEKSHSSSQIRRTAPRGDTHLRALRISVCPWKCRSTLAFKSCSSLGQLDCVIYSDIHENLAKVRRRRNVTQLSQTPQQNEFRRSEDIIVATTTPLTISRILLKTSGRSQKVLCRNLARRSATAER